VVGLRAVLLAVQLGLVVEPNRYLRALLRDYDARGGKVVIRAFSDMAEVLNLRMSLVMNCTGLGAKTLVGDDQLVPVRGQLSILAPQPKVDYIALQPPGHYMFPRSDGIVLGGTFESGATNLDPDQATVRRIVADHAAFFAAMSP